MHMCRLSFIIARGMRWYLQINPGKVCKNIQNVHPGLKESRHMLILNYSLSS